MPADSQSPIGGAVQRPLTTGNVVVEPRNSHIRATGPDQAKPTDTAIADGRAITGKESTVRPGTNTSRGATTHQRSIPDQGTIPDQRSIPGQREATPRAATTQGAIGNERLTAATGALLLALLTVIGVTIVRLRPLISVHLFVGLMLIPVVCLKLASTGYRFVRYYTSDPVYRERGAPPILLRASAPIVVTSSVAVFVTGVALLFLEPQSSGTLRLLHKASFIVWIAFMALHVLGHLPDIQKIFFTRRRGRLEYNRHAAGSSGRIISIVGALAAGVLLAIVLIPHFDAWTHFEATRHHHH